MSECWIDNVCYDTEDVLMIFDEHEMYEKQISLLERKGKIADYLKSKISITSHEIAKEINDLWEINKELEALKGE
jgi:hypothetical protein